MSDNESGPPAKASPTLRRRSSERSPAGPEKGPAQRRLEPSRRQNSRREHPTSRPREWQMNMRGAFQPHQSSCGHGETEKHRKRIHGPLGTRAHGLFRPIGEAEHRSRSDQPQRKEGKNPDPVSDECIAHGTDPLSSIPVTTPLPSPLGLASAKNVTRILFTRTGRQRQSAPCCRVNINLLFTKALRSDDGKSSTSLVRRSLPGEEAHEELAEDGAVERHREAPQQHLAEEVFCIRRALGHCGDAKRADRG